MFHERDQQGQKARLCIVDDDKLAHGLMTLPYLQSAEAVGLCLDHYKLNADAKACSIALQVIRGTKQVMRAGTGRCQVHATVLEVPQALLEPQAVAYVPDKGCSP